MSSIGFFAVWYIFDFLKRIIIRFESHLFSFFCHLRKIDIKKNYNVNKKRNYPGRRSGRKSRIKT